MQEEGVLNQLRKRWIHTRDPSTCNPRAHDEKVEANLDNVLTLFAFWGVGLGISFIIWIFEKLKRPKRSPNVYSVPPPSPNDLEQDFNEQIPL